MARGALTPTTTLADGLHTFTAKEVDAAGNVSAPSNPYGVVIDTQAPGKPTIDSVFDDVGAITGNVPKGGVTDDAVPQIKGKAEAGATVEVFDGGKSIGTTTAERQRRLDADSGEPAAERPEEPHRGGDRPGRQPERTERSVRLHGGQQRPGGTGDHAAGRQRRRDPGSDPEERRHRRHDADGGGHGRART